mgnify:CR=1 FL=1
MLPDERNEQADKEFKESILKDAGLRIDSDGGFTVIDSKKLKEWETRLLKEIGAIEWH